MFTRDSAIDYSTSLIHNLVDECSRTGLSRDKLCEKINISEQQLSMWITGSRPCQLYWVLKNVETALKELKDLPDKHFIESHKK